ncbi:hypothetical protein TRFO_00916 [Tritrichomonas foetus]|uniref:Uncharacterized protein n=1 Tax=Tritrichomonas foetus TaxID=1144522 RepID=A0A1J4L2K1_9EUKA|nr:hypothetical protein TRFO_00916 [Tritrichomonas foetus]|eukprot:OHT17642.1 hypothetical protein TRFO_00916 [Tritrichomonas foetus]
MSVCSFSTRGSKTSEQHYFDIANKLVDGEPPVLVTNKNRRNVIIALVTLRNEFESLKDYAKADFTSRLICQLSKEHTPPPPKKKNNLPSQTPTNYSSLAGKESISSTNSSRDYQNSARQTPNKAPKNSASGCQNDFSSFNVSCRSNISSSNEQSVRFINDDDFYQMSDLIDDLMKNKADINEVTPENRRKMILALRIRREQAKQARKYREVSKIDTITEALQPKKPEGRTNKSRLKEAQDRIKIFDARLAELHQTRENEVNHLLAQREIEYNDLQDSLAKQEESFMKTLPSVDDPSFYHSSAKLMEMWENEKRYVDGFDYDAAIILSKRADELEEEEIRKTKKSIIESQNRRKEKWFKDKAQALDTFKSRWDLKINVAHEKYEKFIDKIEMAKKQVVREAKLYERKVRLGIKA